MQPSIGYLQPFSVQVTLNGLSTSSVVLVIDGVNYPPAVALTPVLVIGQPVTSGATFTIPGPQVLAGAVASILPPRKNHEIGVLFAGDIGNGWLPEGPASNEVALSVAPAVTVQSSANLSSAGSPIQLTASINVVGGTAPTGTVTFFDGGTQLGSPVAVSNGQAILPGQVFAVGNHSITATYNGDANYSAATSGALIEMVEQASTGIISLSLTLSTSANPWALGQALAITATLTAGSGTPTAGSGTPTGSVQFFDGKTPLGTVAVTNNQATLTTSALTAGSHSLLAQYSGDSTFPQATATIGEFISGMASTVTLTASASTVGAGLPVTFTAQVGPAPPAGVPAQTGQVLFQDNGYPIGTVNLASGSATLSVSTLAVGTHTITAVYSGDATWGSSFGRITMTITTPALFLTNAATNLSTVFAPDEIVSVFNVQGLSGDTNGTLPFGTSLSGTSVKITDSTGAVLPALLFGVFASSSQINFVIPSGTATGTATLTVMPTAGASQTLQIQIANLAPGIFSVNPDIFSISQGPGVFAGQIVIVHADGSQTVESSAKAQPSGVPAYIPTPISFAVPTDQVFLQLYGTGLRHASSVTAKIFWYPVPSVQNGTSVTIEYAAAQGTYPGLDQINLQVPSSLAGVGTVLIAITVDGQVANAVTSFIQ